MSNIKTGAPCLYIEYSKHKKQKEWETFILINLKGISWGIKSFFWTICLGRAHKATLYPHGVSNILGFSRTSLSMLRCFQKMVSDLVVTASYAYMLFWVRDMDGSPRKCTEYGTMRAVPSPVLGGVDGIGKYTKIGHIVFPRGHIIPNRSKIQYISRIRA